MQLASSHRSEYWLDGFPELVHEWDTHGNGDVTLGELSAGSGRRVWWTCSRGTDHRWRATPNSRTRGAGCPFCANRRASVTNTLATLFPDVAAEWDPERNGSSTPSNVVATSTRVVWWRCARDGRHVWHTTVRDRTRDLSSCPFCSNHKACSTNSLLASHPLIAAEWHPDRNGLLTTDHVTPGSAKRVWWQCRTCDCEWRASVANRVLRASRCPGCAGRTLQALSPKPLNRPKKT
jgi:hypothetical protein